METTDKLETRTGALEGRMATNEAAIAGIREAIKHLSTKEDVANSRADIIAMIENGNHQQNTAAADAYHKIETQHDSMQDKISGLTTEVQGIQTSMTTLHRVLMGALAAGAVLVPLYIYWSSAAV